MIIKRALKGSVIKPNSKASCIKPFFCVFFFPFIFFFFCNFDDQHKAQFSQVCLCLAYDGIPQLSNDDTGVWQ